MRAGCGCLVGLVLATATVVGLGWATYQALADPALPRVATTAADSRRAQEKLYAIATRSARRGTTVDLSETELNAFLARNLDASAHVPLSDIRVKLARQGQLHFAARTRLGALLGEPPLSALRDLVPAGWHAVPVWIQVVVAPGVEAIDGKRRYVRLNVEAFAIGRQHLPGVLVRLMLDPGTLRLLRWSVPETVEDVRVEPGRVLVRLAS
jgi:hypothetical protein